MYLIVRSVLTASIADRDGKLIQGEGSYEGVEHAL